MSMLVNAGFVALLSLVVAVAPLVFGVVYVIRPSEGRLAVMRPVSLAAIFAALCGFFTGLVNVLTGAARSPVGLADRGVLPGLAESMVPMVVGFGCLTVAWICVALGLRRTSA